MNGQGTTRPHFSIPSIIAIVAAILSFFTSAGWGFALAIVAIVFGFIGVMLSFSPNVRGGVVSVVSLVVGGIAFVLAIIKAIIWLV